MASCLCSPGWVEAGQLLVARAAVMDKGAISVLLPACGTTRATPAIAGFESLALG